MLRDTTISLKKHGRCSAAGKRHRDEGETLNQWVKRQRGTLTATRWPRVRRAGHRKLNLAEATNFARAERRCASDLFGVQTGSVNTINRE